MLNKSLMILVKRNFRAELRMFKKTLIEILTIAALFLLIFLESLNNEESQLKKSCSESNSEKIVQLDNLLEFQKSLNLNVSIIPYNLYFTPDDSATKRNAEILTTNLKLNGSVGFPNEDEMIQNFDPAKTLAACVIHENNLTIRFPNYFRNRKDLNYFEFQDFWLTRCDGCYCKNDNYMDFYIEEGFLQLLHGLISNMLSLEPNISMVRNYETKGLCFNDLNQRAKCPKRFYIWSLYYFIYFLPFLNLISKLSREHEENIFAHHWIYGYTYKSQHFAHFIVSVIHFVLLDLEVFLFLTIRSPLPFHKSFLLLVFLFLFSIMLIIYAMILASLIAKAKASWFTGAALWITCYSVLSEILNILNFEIIKPKLALISLLFFNNMLPNCLEDYFEPEGIKTTGEILELLVIQLGISLVYMVVLVHVDRYKPGPYVNHLRAKERRVLKHVCVNFNSKSYTNNIENGPLIVDHVELKDISECFINFRKCSKLKQISMKFFRNEISVILGPQSSGKTSLIEILAGWRYFQGTIFYQDLDIRDNRSNYRQHLDVLMLNNPLFDCLTIQETLEYFITLKLYKSQNTILDIQTESEKWLSIIRPTIKDPQKLVETLTFGEKRILALCCCLLCDTSVILLDEPKRHLKAEYQTRYWDILKQEKHERFIIVTTSSIDEANEIGDRIAILNDEGYLKAWGTSFYLRNKFSPEFYLICFLKPNTPLEPINQTLEIYITHFKIHHHFNDRVIYKIPNDKKPLFQRLLISLEKDQEKLGITYIYINGSSLNDVYMSLTMIQNNKNHPPDIKANLKFIQDKKSKLNKSLFLPLLYKKLACHANSYMPIFILCICCSLILILNKMAPNSWLAKSIIISASGKVLDNDNCQLSIFEVKDYVNGLFAYEAVNTTPESYKTKDMAGLDGNDDSYTSWFSENVYHMAPVALHLAYGLKSSENSLVIVNKPIILQADLNIPIILGTIMPLTMSLLFATMQDERRSNIFRLENLAGLKLKTRWMATFLFDYTLYILMSILYLILIFSFVIINPSWKMFFFGFSLFTLNGQAFIFFIYFLSLYVEEPNIYLAYVKTFLLQVSLGLFPFIVYNNILRKYCKNSIYLFMLSPGFSFLHGTSKVFHNNENRDFHSYLQWHNPGVLDSICFLILTTLIYFVIFLACSVFLSKNRKSRPKKVNDMVSVCFPYNDDYVVETKVRISNMNETARKSYYILVDQLEKELPKIGKHLNVISFALNRGSCLAIYGSHQSGKTHLIQQLLGIKGYSFGEVQIDGFDLKSQRIEALKHLSYCPQNKALNDHLTPRELFIYCLMLTGVKRSKYHVYIQELCQTFQICSYLDWRIKDLPSNIKRRLNVAVALMVHKEIFILDEPTKGLGAYDRLLIWNVLRHWRSLGYSIVFTTSESLELKELADIVVTVNDGEMLAYTSPHHMEFQYNVGFYLEMKLYADGLTLEEVKENLNSDIENLNRFVMYFHEESELIYRSGTLLKYYVPVKQIKYSAIFGSIEKNRQRLNITDYTLTPFSLDQTLRLLQKLHKEKQSNENFRGGSRRNEETLLKRRRE